MENYKDLVLQNEIGNISSVKPIKEEISIIDAYPLDVVQRIGKYQFIYDYEFGGLQFACIKAPCGSGIDSNKFSKGDVVNVIRFEGTNPVIENPNYKETAPDAPKIGFFASLGDTTKQKEFIVPKEYLQKIDDNTNNNNGKVVPVANNNKKLLMIVGAFLVGYLLFSKETPSN